MKLIAYFVIFSLIFLGLSSFDTPGNGSRANKRMLHLIDTSRMQANETVSYTYPMGGSTKLVLLQPKEENKEDYFKYIFPVFTLLLGIVINKGLDWLLQKKKLKKTGLRWSAEIRGLEEPLKKQIQLLNGLVADERKGTYVKPRLEVIPILDCNTFKTLDKGELFLYLVEVKKTESNVAVKQSNAVHGYLSTLEHLHQSLRQKFDEYLAGTSQYTQSLTSNLQNVSAALAYYGVHLEKLGKEVNPLNYPDYFNMSELFYEHITSKTESTIDVFELHEKLLLPLIHITAALRHEDKIVPIVEGLVACINDIKALKMEKKYWTENIETIRDRYNEQLNDLQNVLTGIN